MSKHLFTLSELRKGHKHYRHNEPRENLYPRTRKRVEAAIATEDAKALFKAIWPFLKRWNKNFYRFQVLTREERCEHRKQLKKLLLSYLFREWFTFYRSMTIETLPEQEYESVVEMFQEFESLLGPVGAAKVLHMIMPKTFPLWDRPITKGYGIWLKKRGTGTNGQYYWRFICISQEQIAHLREQGYDKENVLKRIDERNYTVYTLGQAC